MQRAFLAMVVRLGRGLVLGIAVALSGEFARTPLLFWLATAYVALLPLEVRLAMRSDDFKRPTAEPPRAPSKRRARSSTSFSIR